MTDDRDFAAWLRGRLTERGLTQRQVAARSGVHHSSISRILSGRVLPSHRTARRLTEVLESSWSGPASLTVLLRRDPMLAESDIDRIVGRYRAIRAARERNAQLAVTPRAGSSIHSS